MSATGATLIATAATLTNPSYPGVTAAGTLTANSNRFRVEQATAVVNTIYGGRHVLSATQNLSNHVLLFAAGVNTANNRVTEVTSLTTADGGMFAIFDNLGNYRRWNVFSGALSSVVNVPSLAPVRPHAIDPSCTTSMQAQSATPPNLSNIVAVEFHAKAASTSNTSFRIADIFSVTKTNPIRITGGTIGTPATFADLIAYEAATNRLFFLEASSASKVYGSLAPISLDADVMVDTGSTLVYPVNAANSVSDPRFHVDTIGFRLNVPASGSINVSGLQVKSGAQNIVGAQTLGAGAVATISSFVQTSVSSLTLTAGTRRSGTFLGFGTIALDGATLDSVAFSSGSTLNINSLGPETEITVSSVTAINFNMTPGDRSGLVAGLDPGQVFNITQGAGTYTLTGLTGGTVDNPVVFDNTGGGAVTVIVGDGIEAIADPTPTAGTITVQTPSVDLTASGFADGARFFAARQQTFAIQSADINTTANTIALGNDDETGATFEGQITAPATLALLTLAAGATIPTSSPQIVDGNLYYVVANTSGVVQIGESEGGAAIDFSSTGAQNGSGELFTLRCEAELINEAVSGGSGVSEALTLPEGAIINVAATHRASASSCSVLFERQVEWSATAGATIPDTFSATNNPDTIHNALVGSTIRSKSGLSVAVTSDGATVTGLAFDLSGNIELDANAITDNTISFPDGYLWMKAIQSTETGIRFIRSQFTAVGIMDYRFSKLTLDNVADGTRNSPATTLTVYGNVEPATAGAPVIATGSGTVHIIPFFVADIESSGGGGGGGGDAPTEAEIYTYFTSSGRAEAFKATGFLTGLGTNAPPNWINAAAIATDAITAAKIATDAVTEVQSGLATSALVSASQTAIQGSLELIAGDLFFPGTSDLGSIATSLSEIRGSSFSTTTDSLRAIRTGALTAAQVWTYSGGSRTITALPALPTDWITAASISAGAVTKLATGIEAALLNDGDGQALIDALADFINTNLDLPALELAAIADTVWGRLTSIGPPDGSYGALLINRIDAAITSRSTFNPGTTSVSVGGYATGQSPADLVVGFATPANITAAQGVITTAIGALPAPLDATATTAAAAAALTDYGPAVPSDVQVTVEPTPVTVSGGFLSGDRADLAAAKTAAEATENYTRPMAKQLGLVDGVTATHDPEGITVSDGDGSTAIADNLDGSYTVSKAP